MRGKDTSLLACTLPVVRALLSPAALAEVVGAAYRLDDVSCRLIKATMRDVYRVDARHGPSVLMVYRHGRRTVAEVEAELDVIDFLAEHAAATGVTVAPVIRTRHGGRLLAVPAPEGPRSAVLFQFHEGATLDRAWQPAAGRRYGQLIARLHRLTDSWLATAPSAATRTPLDAALLIDRSLEQIATFLTHRPADLNAVRHAGALLRQRMAALPLDSPGDGLIHGDVIPQNVLVTADGGLTLLDFDFCGPGWRAFDVATYLHVTQERRLPEGDWVAFLAGYESVRQLEPWERAAIPLFVAVRELFRLGNWGPRLEEWGTSALPDDQISRSVGRIDEAVGQLR